MTREEADKLQATFDEYEAVKDRRRASVLKMQFAHYIEQFIPEVKIGGSMDMTALVTGFASAFGFRVGSKPMTISIVDGHEDIDPDDIGWEEYEKLYCVRVPGDIAKEALNFRASKVMYDLASKKIGKDGWKDGVE